MTDRVVTLTNQPPLKIFVGHVGIGMGDGNFRVAMGADEALELATALIEAAMENLEMNARFDEPYLRVVK